MHWTVRSIGPWVHGSRDRVTDIDLRSVARAKLGSTLLKVPGLPKLAGSRKHCATRTTVTLP